MKPDIQAITARRIRQLLRSNRLQQKELAKICEVSQGTVSLWVSGRFPPRLNELLKMSEAFGVSIDWLVKE